MGTSTREPSTATYLRWGGFAAILAAVLIAVGDYWSNMLESGAAFAEFTAQNPFFFAALVGLVGAFLAVFGIIALYIPQAERAGGLGLAGFIGALISAVALAASLWSAAFFFPSLAVDAPGFMELLDAGNVTGPVGPSFLIAGLVQSVGLILFGVATVRAKVYSRIAASAIILGALLMIPQVPFANLIMLAGIAWMGFQLLTGRLDHPASRTVEAPTSSELATNARS